MAIIVHLTKRGRVVLIVALYCRLLLSGIHHAYQVMVLLAVEMQAGSGCSVPNRTVLY